MEELREFIHTLNNHLAIASGMNSMALEIIKAQHTPQELEKAAQRLEKTQASLKKLEMVIEDYKQKHVRKVANPT